MTSGSVRPRLAAVLAFGLLAGLLLGACETGHYPADLFPEMHYQQAYRAGEPPYEERPAGQVPFSEAPSGDIPAPGAEPPLTDFVAVIALPNPVGSSAEAVSAGRDLFATNCSMCHGAEANGVSFVASRFELSGEKPPPSLTRDELSALPDGSLFWTVTNGVNRMPSFKRLLNAEERWTIISYIRSL